ncbi:hypothetical protein [Lysobacter humi (ex Lee et al. 2017)]
MARDPTRYFALVRRVGEGRYTAQLPDFPDLQAEAPRLDLLVADLRRHIAAALATRAGDPPGLPPLTGLPARLAAEDGFWLQIDVDPSA